MSPERIAGDDYSYASDVWSLGLCLLGVAEGRLPLPTHLGYWAVVRAIQEDPSPTFAAPANWSAPLRDFISLCLAKDPKARPLPADLREHPFLARHRAAARALPASPPAKPTSGVLAHLHDLAAVAAAWHKVRLAAEPRESPGASPGASLGASPVRLPPLEGPKVAGLAHQLNVPAQAVAEAFQAAWDSANRELAEGSAAVE